MAEFARLPRKSAYKRHGTAIRIHQYGGPEVLAQVEMQRPAPGANEVLIKVALIVLWHHRASFAGLVKP